MTGVWFAIFGLIIASGDHLAKGMGGTHLASFPIFLVVVGLFFMRTSSAEAIYVSDYSSVHASRTPTGRVDFRSGGRRLHRVHRSVLRAARCVGHRHRPHRGVPGEAVIRERRGPKWVLWFSALSLVAGAAMNAYTGMLSWDSVRSTWQQVKLSRPRPCVLGSC